MIKAALLQNIQTRPDVFGTRHFAPLPGVRMPLPTLPPIVGGRGYGVKPLPGPIDKMARTPEQLDAWYRQRYGASYIAPGTESPASQYYRTKLGQVRNMIAQPLSGVSEPSLNNPQK